MHLRDLRGLTFKQLTRAAVRKYVYRYDEMGYYTVDRDVMKRVVASDYETLVMPGAEVPPERLANPYVDDEAIAQLHSNRGSSCVLVLYEGAVVGSNWFLRGSVHIDELDRSLNLAGGTAYSCRTYTNPEHRGRHLMGHMMTAFLDSDPDCQELCGVIYDWNTASIRGVVNLGWRRRSTLWSRRILGRQHTGERLAEAS